MKNAFQVLSERGFVKQVTHEGLEELLGREKITFYIGFDPTADSLHVGHFVVLMAMAHMQRAGHRPIVLLGGGTGMIGDPSGKSDMRKMMTRSGCFGDFCNFFAGSGRAFFGKPHAHRRML